VSSPKRAVVLVWLFTALFLPLMLALGFWQLDRADQKKAWLIELEAQRELPARPYPDNASEVLRRFEPRMFVGQYANQHWLLDNRQHQGQIGYELLTTFILRDGRPLLVNRGWLAAPKYRAQLPAVITPLGEQVLTGYFYWSDKPLPMLGDVSEPPVGSVQRIQSVNWAELNRGMHLPFAEPTMVRLVNGEEIGAQEIAWVYTENGPEKHHGYAVQWFSMSLALFVLACWSSVRLSRSRITENNNKE